MSRKTSGAHEKRKSKSRVPSVLLLAVLLAGLAYIIYLSWNLPSLTGEDLADASPSPSASDNASLPPSTSSTPDDPANQDDEPTIPDYHPYAVSSTLPSLLVKSTDILVNGEKVEGYSADEENVIDFTYGDEYTEAEGIITFRGNNFRDGGSYGTADMDEYEFGTYWTHGIASLTAPDGAVWNGAGWTGQPLIINWSYETRQNMNMYEWAKAKEELVEVIYATMDGNIYFLDLTTGESTRDSLNIGYTFKGSGSLDPRGYPILYVGAGYDSYKGTARAFIISLIDGKILYEFGNNDSFSLRALSYFDSAPLIDAETDQLIYPGENGILYIIRLNTEYDPEAGTISVDPDNVVKWRYYGTRTSNSSHWLGIEDSAVIWRGHIIMSDNGGHLFCLDLNTLELVWVQDTLDDTNCTPVLELEDGHPYIYTSTSFHGGWRAPTSGTAVIPIWKIDAVTGEIVWQVDYTCYTESGVSGGVQGTIAVGKNNLSDLIFVPVARVGNGSAGVLAAIDKKTGDLVWELTTVSYSWSSPTIVYDADGDGYIIYPTAEGAMFLLDGRTNEILDTFMLGSTTEATAAVYGNTLVIGTRGERIYGITLK